MFVIADARGFNPLPGAPWGGLVWMRGFGGSSGEHQPFRHAKGFNFLFCDSHVALVNRRDFTDMRRTAQNWNNDHGVHPETWSGK
jgi:prepilin-type processing-associated H-X9-DG protein